MLQRFASTIECAPGTAVLEASKDLFGDIGESMDGFLTPNIPKQAWQECKALGTHKQSWHEVKTELKLLCNQTEELVAQLEDSNMHSDMSAWVQAQLDISGLNAVWPPRGENEHSQHGDASDASSDTGNTPGLTEHHIFKLSSDASLSEGSDSSPPELESNKDSSTGFPSLELTEADREQAHRTWAQEMTVALKQAFPRWAPSCNIQMIFSGIKAWSTATCGRVRWCTPVTKKQ
jgi:hypothetical protein